MSSQQQQPFIVSRLSIMMFLQFFTWGAWFVTLGLAMGSNGLGDFIGGAYGTAPLAAIFAPLFLGLIADRFFPSEKVLAALMLTGGALMAYVAFLAPQEQPNGGLIVNMMLAYMCCFMPTLGLTNTVTFYHLKSEQFPKVRVWGTIGWIVAGLVVGFAGWSASLNIFWLACVSSFLLGIFSFFLPKTPAPAKGKEVNIRSLLMLDAFTLFKNPAFAVFAACSTLVCIPLAYYYAQTSQYLGSVGFAEASATMTLGQMSEIVFMIMIPFFFRKLGVKMMLIIGMVCWVLRYALFAFGAPEQVTWMILLGVLLHGICYDFFFVTGFMYTDHKAKKDIRGQAQGLLVFLTQGIGMYFGYLFAFGGKFIGFSVPSKLTVGETVYGASPSNDLNAQIAKINEGEPEKGAMEKLSGMFDKGYPEGVDETLVESTMTEWSNYWMFPMILALVVLVIFAVSFWDKVDFEDEEVIEEPQPQEDK